MASRKSNRCHLYKEDEETIDHISYKQRQKLSPLKLAWIISWEKWEERIRKLVKTLKRGQAIK